MNKVDKCERCEGSGYEPGDQYKPTYEELVNCDPRACSRCWGSGKAEDPISDLDL